MPGGDVASYIYSMLRYVKMLSTSVHCVHTKHTLCVVQTRSPWTIPKYVPLGDVFFALVFTHTDELFPLEKYLVFQAGKKYIAGRYLLYVTHCTAQHLCTVLYV
jgi:hypothetical protein